MIEIDEYRENARPGEQPGTFARVRLAYRVSSYYGPGSVNSRMHKLSGGGWLDVRRVDNGIELDIEGPRGALHTYVVSREHEAKLILSLLEVRHRTETHSDERK